MAIGAFLVALAARDRQVHDQQDVQDDQYGDDSPYVDQPVHHRMSARSPDDLYARVSRGEPRIAPGTSACPNAGPSPPLAALLSYDTLLGTSHSSP